MLNFNGTLVVSNHPGLLFALFERKNPHLFEERFVDGLKMEHLDAETFQHCRNVTRALEQEHPWTYFNDEEILLHARLARKDELSGTLKITYAALILFGKESAIEEFMHGYRFEALFHMCTFEQYNDSKNLSVNRYDDRRTMRCNLINAYRQLLQFAARYLPDRFYLPEGTPMRMDIRHFLFREIIANLCVHADYGLGGACFFHVFKDRVVTRNPNRLISLIPEGKLTPEELGNYTKNPLLARVFRELNYIEEMGTGIRNILRYAPIYYPDYKVEINNGFQFEFSITYMDTPQGYFLKESPSTVSPKGNGIEKKISPLEKKSQQKKRRRQQGIVGLIHKNPKITIEELAEKLDVNERTIRRDIEELKFVIKHVGPTKGGNWEILKAKKDE